MIFNQDCVTTYTACKIMSLVTIQYAFSKLFGMVGRPKTKSYLGTNFVLEANYLLLMGLVLLSLKWGVG